MRSQFGASSNCARTFRISSLRSPLARGMRGDCGASILSRASSEDQAGQFGHRGDAQIDERHPAPLARYPHGRHAQAVRGAQVLEGVVDEGTAVGVEVMLAQQEVKAVQRRLAAIARVLDAVDAVEV